MLSKSFARVLLTVAFGALPLLAGQHRMILQDGTIVNGTFIQGNERDITFEEDGGRRQIYRTNDVRSLDFNAPSRVAEYRGSTPLPVADARESGPHNHLVPAGTQIVVRTNELIRSSRAAPDRLYSAVVESDIRDASGRPLIPRGSEATLIVRDVGRGEISLDLDSVTVNGRRHNVDTADVTESARRDGIGTNKRTATMVGGGAVLGTLLGAIAGGGKGAAIGALAGGAAGGTAQVLTRGKEVRVEPETVLTFRLDRDLNLRADR